MVLLRRLLGDALRRARQRQHRTLRDVSAAARVSLGYLSEVERGQKEPSSELLAAICDALEVRLSDLLTEVSAAAELEQALVGTAVPVRERVVIEPVVIDRAGRPVPATDPGAREPVAVAGGTAAAVPAVPGVPAAVAVAPAGLLATAPATDRRLRVTVAA